MPSALFTPMTLATPSGEGLVVRNRTIVAPMCQYSVDREDGVPTNWHLQHVGSFAAGGFGMVTVEATAVEAVGRISPRDVGLWNAEQRDAHRQLVDMAHDNNAAIAVQLAHAGGKAGTYPWLPGFTGGSVPVSDGGWETIAPSAGPVIDGLAPANAMTTGDISRVVEAFAESARLADEAGYDAIQLHGAHGYLMHQFLSPLSNRREDEFGGDASRRMRFGVEIAEAVRAVWPAHKPVGIRVSATDWNSQGLSVDDVIEFLQELVSRELISWVDVSSGGLPTDEPITSGPGYQLPFATRIAQGLADTEVVVSAVGSITDAAQAETIVSSSQAHAVSIGRAALGNPHWAATAAAQLRVPSDQNPASPPLWRASW